MLGRKSKENRRLRMAAAVTFVVMVGANMLANILPLNGQTTGEVSDKYANLFAPTGFTFFIWSVIYVLLGLYTLYQLGVWRDHVSKLKPDFLNRISTYYAVTSLLNVIWIVAWHYEVLWLTVLIIFGILYCLVKINLIIRQGKLTTREKLSVRLPFSVYFGWITVATIANVSVWLVSTGWRGGGWGEDVWAVIMLTVGAIIAFMTMHKLRTVSYGLVFVWAYFGILAKHLAGVGWNGEHPAVIGSVSSLLAVLLLYTLYLTYTEYDFPKKLI